MSVASILKDLNKKYEGIIATVGVDQARRTRFSLGSPSLDICTYNSIPEGSWIELSGGEGSGKTLLAFLMASDYSKKELKKPQDERRNILFVDCEHTLDKEWAMTSAHYDVDAQDIKTIYLAPTGQSAEQIFDMVRDLVTTGEIGLVIFDSLTAIAPQLTNDESFEKKDMGGISKPLGDFVKRCTGLFARYRTTFVGINGSIMNIGGYGNPETTGGGTHWRRACSLRLRVRKGKFLDEDGTELSSSAENPAGVVIETALLKSKFCRSDRRLGRCHLYFRQGIDLLQDTIEVAINLGLIDDSVQGSFKLIDPNTGEVLKDDSGNELKIRGRKNIRPYFEEHPQLWKDLYDKVYAMISEKQDTNIKSFEELLNVDVQKAFDVNFAEEEAE